MRRHMQGMSRRRSDLRIGARCRKRQDGVVGIVEGMNNEMRGGGMVWILLKDLQADSRSKRLTAKTFIAGSHGSQQREGVENIHFVISRPAIVHFCHGLRIGIVASELVV